MSTILFLKAIVKGHTRQTRNGTVFVNPYSNKRAAAASDDPHHADLKGIAHQLGRRDKAVSGSGRNAPMNASGFPRSSRAQERVEEDAIEAVRGHIHAMHQRGVAPGSKHEAIVNAGHAAFGRHDEFRGEIDPDAFAEAFRKVHPG